MNVLPALSPSPMALWLLAATSQALAVVRQARNYETARQMLGLVEAENPIRLMDEITTGQESGGFDSQCAETKPLRCLALHPRESGRG